MSVNGSVLSRLALSAASTGLSALRGWPAYRPLPASPSGTPRPHREYQDALWALYEQTGVYDAGGTALALQGTQAEALRALRLPAHRCVEFHAAHIWPGMLPDALPIETDNQRIIPAIEQLWLWSNWSSNKQVLVRKAAAMGEAFIRTAVRPDQTRVYLQVIDPRNVPDFDTDERGFLTRIRIDTPKVQRDGNRVKTLTRTEVWEKQVAVDVDEDGTPITEGSDTRRVWLHDKGDEPDLDKLGVPTVTTFAAMQLTYIPIVRLPWQDRGEQHGAGAYSHAVEKIVDGDRATTHLHQQTFRGLEETWVLEAPGRLDALGREIPPPVVEGLGGSSTRDDGRVQMGNMRLIRTPSGWQMVPKVAPLAYGDARNINNDHSGELAKDLPELRYFDTAELGANASGRARRIHLAPAIDRALEARAQCEEALKRAVCMALDAGSNLAAAGIPEMALFRNIGTFDAGDFAFRFKERDVLPPDRIEDAQADLSEGQALAEQLKLLQGGAPALFWKRLGWSEEEVTELVAEQSALAAAAEEARQAQAAAQQQQQPAAPGQMAPSQNGRAG